MHVAHSTLCNMQSCLNKVRNIFHVHGSAKFLSSPPVGKFAVTGDEYRPSVLIIGETQGMTLRPCLVYLHI